MISCYPATQDMYFENSISCFNAEQQHAINKKIAAFCRISRTPSPTNPRTLDILPSTFTSPHQFQFPLHQPPRFSSLSSLIPSISPVHSSSASGPYLFLLDVSGGTGNMCLTNAIQVFLLLGQRIFFALLSSTVAPQILQGGITGHSSLNIPVPCSDSSSSNNPAESQLATELQNPHLIV